MPPEDYLLFILGVAVSYDVLQELKCLAASVGSVVAHESLQERTAPVRMDG